jgi:hypothetical protein
MRRTFVDNLFLAIPCPPMDDPSWYRVEGFFTEEPSEAMRTWFAERGRTLEVCTKNEMHTHFVYMEIPVDIGAVTEIKMRWNLEMYDQTPLPPKPEPVPYTGQSLWPDLSQLFASSPERCSASPAP